jgi:hypothetical protein
MTKKDWVEAIVNLTKTLIWPLLIVVVLLMYHDPIKEIVKLIPSKIRDSQKLGIGSLLIEMQETAFKGGNEELANIFGALSPEAIRRLIELGKSNRILVIETQRQGNNAYIVPTPHLLRIEFELMRNGLIEFKEDFDKFQKWIKSDLFQIIEADSFYITIRPVSHLSKDDSARIINQSYKLTKIGSEAWEAVLNSIYADLKKDPPTRYDQ